MYSSDSFEMTPEQYDNGFRKAGTVLDVLHLNVWETPYLDQAIHKNSFWKTGYEGVYMANLVLTNVDQVSGSQVDKDKVKARAHLLRAYSYFDLAQYYCLPYSQATLGELGLTIKLTTGYEEDVRRVSLKDTYDFIEADIKAAQSLSEPLFVDGVRMGWKETTATAHALAARFYLATENYPVAGEAANKVLAIDDYIRDYRSGEIKQVMDFMSGQMVASNTVEDQKQIAYIANWDRAFYNRTPSFLLDACFPIISDKLRDTYGSHGFDLRDKYFALDDMKNVSLLRLFVGGNFPPTYKVPGYHQHSNQSTSLAPNVAEMLLTKIESMARQGNYQQAMTELNKFRRFRMDDSAPKDIVELVAASKEAAVLHILAERHREFPYTVRWSDLRRINFNSETFDDVVLTKTFYPVTRSGVDYNSAPKTYTLEPGSRKYAVAIPMDEISASNDVIVQNSY